MADDEIQMCSSSHCSGVSNRVNATCKKNNWQIGHLVMVCNIETDECCYCTCSCVANGTPIQVKDGIFVPIESFKPGDTVLAAGKSLDWHPEKVQFSDGTNDESTQDYAIHIKYDQTSITVTADHVFLLHGGAIKEAAKLTPADKLVAPDGNEVAIKSIHLGEYKSGFHHIATKQEKPNDSLDGHLINTNGVISGDYAVQMYFDELPQPMHSFIAEPEIGSREYIKRWGDGFLKAPPPEMSISATGESVPVVNERFISAEKLKTNIPAHACSFISDEDAEVKAQETMRSWADPQAREWTKYLLNYHQHFYSNVVFHFDWADPTVNAYAWKEGGKPHVAIKGGLVQHHAIKLESTALVVAHELGHHYGGAPTFPEGLSCEGQADYSGVRDIMREVWFGTQYTAMAKKGIHQMAEFFGVPDSPDIPSGNAGCKHPEGSCRIATYYTALSLMDDKPACAGSSAFHSDENMHEEL